jgi:general secretion pathway protein D
MDTPDKLEAMELLINEVDVPIATQVFELSYAKAEDLSAKLGEVLTKNVGSIRFDARSNKIFVTDTPQKIEEIAKMVKAFDVKHKEVLIEAKIVQIVLSDQYKMGVDWEAIVSDFHTLDLAGKFSILSATDKKGKLSIGTLSRDDYTVLLEALDAVGETNILSNPSITAINNQEAKILVGSTQPYVTTTTTTPATGAVTTAESVNFIDVGVKLYVTPTVHNDNYITMKIKPEVSTVTRFLTTSQNNTIPVVETSEAETTVMVKDGVTIVIGGLIKDEKIDTINKVPLLGDMPIVGFAFRNRDQLIRKTELVIFLTPKIISGDIHIDERAENFSSKIE